MTIITAGFTIAADARAEVLGLPEHPRVVTDHPLASRTKQEVEEMAERSVEDVVRALLKR